MRFTTYRRRFGYLLLCSCDVFRLLINSLNFLFRAAFYMHSSNHSKFSHVSINFSFCLISDRAFCLPFPEYIEQFLPAPSFTLAKLSEGSVGRHNFRLPRHPAGAPKWFVCSCSSTQQSSRGHGFVMASVSGRNEFAPPYRSSFGF